MIASLIFLSCTPIVQNAAVPSLGFNAKANVDPEIQVTQVRAAFKTLAPTVVKNMTIRISGGTRSQIDLPADWAPSTVTAWINLQKEFGFKLSYTVNGNDQPESQLRFLQSWQKQGATFAFIEMMNEYYLAKYREGTPNGKDVTKKITAQDYVNTILPTWAKVLSPLRSKLFVILAPQKQQGGKSRALAQWNETVITALNGPLRAYQFGVTVHLYKPANQVYDYDQVSRLRGQLPPGTAFAITEAGVQEATSVTDNAAQEADHLKKIALQLNPQDYLMDQILYKPASADFEGCVANNGITPKGKAVFNLYSTLVGTRMQ